MDKTELDNLELPIKLLTFIIIKQVLISAMKSLHDISKWQKIVAESAIVLPPDNRLWN